jgi:hypothetical protein
MRLKIDVQPIEHVSARALIRAWHRLHTALRIPHDYTQMLAPRPTPQSDVYHAAIYHDDVRAIAIAKCVNETSTIVGVAYAPEQLDAAGALVAELAQRADVVVASELQPRWRCEAAYYAQD